MDTFTRFCFRGDAVLDFSFGVLLSLSPWIRPLFDLLDLPNPQPELFTQFGGVLLIGFAYLLWIAPGEPALARAVGLSVGLINLVGVIAILAWLISGQLGVGTLGALILIAACALLTVFSAGELRYVLKSRG